MMSAATVEEATQIALTTLLTRHPRDATIGWIYVAGTPQAALKQQQAQAASSKRPRKTEHGRHVRWDPYRTGGPGGGPMYEKIRDGIPIESEACIKELADQDGITEAHFFLFRHCDPHVERNAALPLYEAAYWCVERNCFVLAQKRHMQRAYSLAKRTDRTRVWDMLAGEPYWVDRHAFRVQAQRDSKQRHAEKQRRKN